MTYFVIMIQISKIIRGKPIVMDVKKEFVIDNMETAIEVYSNFVTRAEEAIEVGNISVTVSVFRPLILDSGVVTEIPENKEYIINRTIQSKD